MRTKRIKCKLEWIDSKNDFTIVRLVDDPSGDFTRAEFHYNWFERISIKLKLIGKLPHPIKISHGWC